jgi:hypothetical protein
MKPWRRPAVRRTVIAFGLWAGGMMTGAAMTALTPACGVFAPEAVILFLACAIGIGGPLLAYAVHSGTWKA